MVSVAGAEAPWWLPVIALDGSSGRGLGWVLLKWFARRASRFGYHGTRTVGIRFRRRGKGKPLEVLARLTKRLRFYEDAAKVVQRRMLPNFNRYTNSELYPKFGT